MALPLSPDLARWSLTPTGPALQTGNASLQPVLYQGQPAMLKLAKAAEEQAGYDLLQWWQGQGAVQVLARDGAVLLMERVTGPQSLAQLSQSGQDDEACRIACRVVAQLHAARSEPPPALVPLHERFAALRQLNAPVNSVLHQAQQAMHALLAQPQPAVCLHGDVHHHNILDAGARGWLAIDPKGLWGERGFDYANLFCNPDAATACNPAHFQARLDMVATQAQLPPQRLLQWILAWAGLSAIWHQEDGTSPTIALQVAQLASQALG